MDPLRVITLFLVNRIRLSRKMMRIALSQNLAETILSDERFHAFNNEEFLRLLRSLNDDPYPVITQSGPSFLPSSFAWLKVSLLL